MGETDERRRAAPRRRHADRDPARPRRQPVGVGARAAAFRARPRREHWRQGARGARREGARGREARVARDRPALPTGALRDRLKRAAEADNYLLPPDPRREAQKAPHAKRQTRLQLARMALALFHDAIRRAKLGTATEKQRALLEPFIAPLADAFRSSDNQW
jgi:hypothetical protein